MTPQEEIKWVVRGTKLERQRIKDFVIDMKDNFDFSGGYSLYWKNGFIAGLENVIKFLEKK